MRRLKTVRRPPIYPKTPRHLPCSSLTHPLPLSSRRPSVSFGGFGLKNACYWNYWRVYVPQGARLLSSTPLPLPKYSVAAEIGRAQPGEDTVSVSSSYNKSVLSGLFALDAGHRNEVSLVYDLPAQLVHRSEDEISYRLLIQKQPGIRRREVTVEFILPDGFRLASSSVSPASDGDSRVGFSLLIDRDTELVAVFTRGQDDSR